MDANQYDRWWVKRQSLVTRLTHWVWALCVFFLLGSGLQIFNAHPVLYIGDQSGFGFDNSVLALTGTPRAFPAWATIPGGTDLATGRVIHFFFAWVLLVTLVLWFLAGLLSGHLRKDLMPGRADFREFGRDVGEHLRLKFRHRRRYGPLQKFSYAAVLFGVFPLIFATGLAMSPGLNAAFPWLPEILGGRQTARTLHFFLAFGLLVFVAVHLVMIVLAGPLNELRSMVTGRYRVDEENRDE